MIEVDTLRKVYRGKPMKKVAFIALLFSIAGLVFARASQSEISKMETELTAFKKDLDKVENNRSKMDLQHENMLDIIQLQYKNLFEILTLAKKGDRDTTDQSMRSMRLILQQYHNLTKQMFGEYLETE